MDPEKTAVAKQRLGKHAVFSTWSVSHLIQRVVKGKWAIIFPQNSLFYMTGELIAYLTI
jgi:hypothetical protein